jgi:hypothetical protein
VADHRVRVKGYTHHTSFGSGAWPGRRIFVQPNFRRLRPQYEGLNSGKNRPLLRNETLVSGSLHTLNRPESDIRRRHEPPQTWPPGWRLSAKSRSSHIVNPPRRERLLESRGIRVQLSDCGLWVAAFVDWISERASARSDRRPHRVAMLSERSLQASQLIFRRPGVLCS